MRWVFPVDPAEQGLKRDPTLQSSGSGGVFPVDPAEQGLKLSTDDLMEVSAVGFPRRSSRTRIETWSFLHLDLDQLVVFPVDPAEQGLKLPFVGPSCVYAEDVLLRFPRRSSRTRIET